MVIGAGLAAWIPVYRQAQQDADDIAQKLSLPTNTESVIYSGDATPVPIFRTSSLRRTYVDVRRLPDYVRNAIVCAEDRRFYEHRGVDAMGLLRSVWLAVREGHTSQGGSTIDMQLAKKLVNGEERSFERKLKDIATAQQIENLKTKDQILDIYMNEVYFGEGAYGIESAAETYFGKHADKLTIAEAATLARCIRHPTRGNPVHDKQGSISRRNDVLQIMRDEGWITDSQYEQAKSEKLKLNPKPPEGVRWIDPVAGYFVDHVVGILHDDGFDLQTGGYKIYTTLNYRLQKAAVSAVNQTIRDYRGWRVNDGAFVMTDTDGRILAEVGGPNYNKSKWNVITSARRQPGSAFKAIVYATALRDGIVHMGDSLSNAAIYHSSDGTPWTPHNNGRERIGGTFSLTSAFAMSVNLPAIHTVQNMGPRVVVDSARQVFGITSKLPAVDSIAIGTGGVTPLEMDEAYSVFMLGGDRVHPCPIVRVEDSNKVVQKAYSPTVYRSVLDSGVCQDMDELFEAVVQHGTGTAASDVPDARGKTGTTQEAKDAWFCGYSDGLLGIGWVGNTSKSGASRSMSEAVFGGTVTAKMWRNIMLAAHSMNLGHAPAPKVDRVAVRTRRQKPPKDDVPLDPGMTDAGDPNAATPKPPTDQKPTQNDGTQPRKDNNDPNLPQPPANPPPTQPTDDDTPTKPEKQPSQDDDSDSKYVDVQICADTGMRASAYCPETVTRRYRKGTEPRKLCTLHTG